MTQANVDLVTAKAKTDVTFLRSLREDADTALAGYDLTPAERANLKGLNLGAEPPHLPPHPKAGKKPADEPPGTLGGHPVQ